MWEYGFRDERFEIVIRVKHNPCADPVSLNKASQSIDDLIDEFQKKVRDIMDYEYKGNFKKLCPSGKT
jgi:hypothetical protein